MKYFTSFFFLILMMSAISCRQSNTGNPGEWTDEQLNSWFNQKSWLGQSTLQPDTSINKRELAIHYYQHPGRWDKAFAFLKQKDLAMLDTGRYEIDGKNVFALVTAYMTKDPGEVNFEMHKVYTDIQMVASGTEYIERGDTTNISVVAPYDAVKDVTLGQLTPTGRFLAKPGTFFIFFPVDAHRPYLKADTSEWVKKVIIKVKN